jgi:hypothetical protein
MSVPCMCCVVSSRGLCDGCIPLRDESYWVWRAWVWSRNLNKRTRTMNMYVYIYIYKITHTYIYQCLITNGSRFKFDSLSYSEWVAKQCKWWIYYTCILSLQHTFFLPLHVPFFTPIFICDSWCRKHGHKPSLVRSSDTFRTTTILNNGIQCTYIITGVPDFFSKCCTV